MDLPRYLQKRRLRWYAILEIPKSLRSHLGRVRFLASLQTDSRTVAERRVLPVITAWKKEIAKARNEPVGDDAAFWRQALRNAKTDEQRQVILDHIETAMWEIGAINVENIGDPPSGDPEARLFFSRATGSIVDFTEHLEEWLSTSQATAKTQDMQSSSVKRFAGMFKNVQDVTRPEVRRWINKLINEDGLTPKTVQRILSGLRGYWRYLQSIGVAGEDDEPFSKLDVARQAKYSSPKATRQPFEPSDVLKLLDAAVSGNDQGLADLIRLGMWTGCRIEELCALKTDQIKAGYFSVNDAKTRAGWRDVPIHRELADIIERLVKSSEDGFVLSGLTKNKYGDRSNAVGKRFGRLKKELGFDTQYVFHSIRKTVVTILENAGVQENIVADIVGHEKTTMTYGLYSGGLSIAMKQEALDKLIY
jgi:integrase